MKTLTEKIEYKENPILGIAKILKENKYEIADKEGRRLLDITGDYTTIGILKEREPKETKFLGIRWKKKQERADYIGKINILSNEIQLDIYGRSYINEIRDIAEQIAQKYDMKIILVLNSEKPKEEKPYPKSLDDYM